MWLFSRLHHQTFCAFCKVPRRVYRKKHVDVTNVLGAVVFALAVTFAIWAEPDPRGLMLFCLFIAGAEIFVYGRWRMAIACKMCGFDAILYKKSPAGAALRVKEFYREQSLNPNFWLTKSPLLQVQRNVRRGERLTFEKNARLERAAYKTSMLQKAPRPSSLPPTKSV